MPGVATFILPGLALENATLAGLNWTYIPTKGGAQALQDVAGGHADLIFNSMLATAPHVKSGSLRLLGFASPQRIEGFPDTPTVGESFAGYTAGSWQGITADLATAASCARCTAGRTRPRVNSLARRSLPVTPA